jgi:hypothetical protein
VFGNTPGRCNAWVPGRQSSSFVCPSRRSDMPKVAVEKLPPHWLFVPSKRQVRDLLRRLDADVRLVEFHGTHIDRMAGRLCLGYMEARAVDGGWRFYLRVWGVREAAVGPIREEVAGAALAEIERCIRDCLDRPPADIIKPSQLSLSFRVDPDGVHSECRTRVLGRHSYSPHAWWECEPPA